MSTHSVRFLFLLTLFVFATVSSALAGPITGVVLDPDKRPVPGATVFIRQGGTIVGSTTADKMGAFTMQGPDRGEFEVDVAVAGFRATPLALTGQPEPRDIGSISLKISAQAESVVVSAAAMETTLSSAATSVTVIAERELQAAQVESLHDVLKLVPGLTVASSGGRGALTSVFPRGGESDYSLVLIDGVPANAFGGGFDFAHLPVVNIDRVEIVRGPQSALYGSNAIGSVIRVITKRYTAPSLDASFEGGSFGTSRIAAASSGSVGSFNKFEWGGSAERLATDGMNGRRTASGEIVTNDDYERHLFSGSAGWRGSGDATIRADARYQTDERGFPGPFGSDPGGSFEGIDQVSRGTNDRWLAGLYGATPAMNSRVRATALLTHGRTDSTFLSSFSPGDPTESSSRRTTARVQSDVFLLHSVLLSAGVEWQGERAGSTFITEAGEREVPVERSLAGFFGEARWANWRLLSATAGVRVERITRKALPGDPDAFAPRPDFDDDTVVSVNPKFSAAWLLRETKGEQTKLRGSAGTGIRAPDAIEIAFTDNPGLKPERSRSFDIGVEQSLIERQLVLELTGFFNDYDDLIVAVGRFNGSSQYRTDNISNARARGLEAAGSGRIFWMIGVPLVLQLRVGYTLLDTEIRDVDQGSGAPPPFAPGDALLRRPKHQFGLDAVVTVSRVTGFIQGNGRTSVRDVDPTFGTFGGLFDAPGYSAWNAGVSWKVIEQAHVFARVNNLFNRQYEEVLGFPALTRGFFAGVRFAASR